MQCEYVYTSGGCAYSREDEKPIRVTRDQILPNLRKKWDRMHSKAQQRRLLKEKTKEFLRSLEVERQRIEDIYQDAQKRLGKFIS